MCKGNVEKMINSLQELFKADKIKIHQKEDK